MDDRGILGGMHPFVKLILLALVMVGSTLVVFVVGMLIAMPFFGPDMLRQLGDTGPENIQLLRYVQLLSHLGLFVGASLVFAYLVGGRPLRYLGSRGHPGMTALVLGALVMIAALPMVNFLVLINEQLSLPESLRNLEEWMRRTEEAAEAATRLFLDVSTWQGLLFNIFLIALIPAIGEEFVFRGIVQKLFRQWTGNVHLGVIIAAVLFSAMHLQFFGFLPRLLLGLLLGYMFVYTRNIWVPVFAHFFNNAAAVIIYFLAHNDHIDFDVEGVGAGRFAPLLFLFSLLMVLLLLRGMWRVSRHRHLLKDPP